MVDKSAQSQSGVWRLGILAAVAQHSTFVKPVAVIPGNILQPRVEAADVYHLLLLGIFSFPPSSEN